MYVPPWVYDAMSERRRQEMLKDQGKFRYTCADLDCTDQECCNILTEEFLEVVRAVNDRSLLSALREELIQVIAVAGAWCEKIDSVTFHLKK